MGFLFKQKKENIVAIFDIGSGSVGGAIAHIPKDRNSIPVIVKSVVNEIKFHKGFDSSFDSFMQDMTSTLNETVTALYDKKVGSPDEIFCVFASPWYLSETRSVKMSREKSFTFTKRLASDLIEKEISSLTELYKSKYGTLDSVPQVIEQHTMSVSLNGYPTEEPIGKECKSVEMNMVISLSPKLCLDRIRETISKTYHHKNVSFSSFTLASYLAVRDKYIDSDSYLLIDVRGEITDVGIVTKGVLKSVLSFPFGKKTFFKYICTKLEIELRDAQELFKLYSEGHLSDEFKNKFIPLFKSIEGSWREAFGECISTLPRTLVLPGVVFLTADSDVKEWFADVLKNEEHIQSMSTNNKYTVITLESSEFLNMCNIKDGSCDPFLIIEAIFITRKKNK